MPRAVVDEDPGVDIAPRKRGLERTDVCQRNDTVVATVEREYGAAGSEARYMYRTRYRVAGGEDREGREMRVALCEANRIRPAGREADDGNPVGAHPLKRARKSVRSVDFSVDILALNRKSEDEFAQEALCGCPAVGVHRNHNIPLLGEKLCKAYRLRVETTVVRDQEYPGGDSVGRTTGYVGVTQSSVCAAVLGVPKIGCPDEGVRIEDTERCDTECEGEDDAHNHQNNRRS